MSIECMKWAFELGIPSTEKFVLVALGNCANIHDGATWTAWPSIKYLAQRTSLHETTVKLAIKQVCDWGLITKTKRKIKHRTARGNNYTLHIERAAPQDVEAIGSAGQPIPDIESKTIEEPTTYEDESPHRLSTTTYDRDSSTTDADLPQDSSTTFIGTPGQPVYKNPNLETKYTPYPINQTPDELASDLWRKALTVYQQHGLNPGDEKYAWPRWQKLSLEKMHEIAAKLPIYLSGKRAQYAKWDKAPDKKARGRKPSYPAGIADFIATNLVTSIGLPAEADATTDPQGKSLCEKILQRNAPAEELDFKWPFWLSVDSPQYQQWELYFRAHGFSAAPRRQAGQIMFEHTPKNLAALGIKSIDPKSALEMGWRFPTEWAPDFDAEAPCAA